MSVSGSEGPRESGSDPRSEPTRRITTLEEEEASGTVVKLTAFGATDVGLVREHNEDNFIFVDLDTEARIDASGGQLKTELGQRGFFAAVCDGMGGAAAGEVASQMGVDILAELLLEGDGPSDRDEFAQRLVDAIQEAGIRIFGAAKMDRTRRGMGTTSTVAGMIDEILFVGQVGDSRAYVLRQGELRLITKDQSLVNQLIEAGQLTEEEAESFEHSNIILQALGTTERVAVDLTFLEMRRGDRLMLCSDGLSGLVHSSAIADTLSSINDPEEAARSLIAQANEGGGHDNITCVIIDFDGPGLAPPSGESLPSYQQYPLAGKDAERAIVSGGREPSVKTVAQKPGADVKRGRASAGKNGKAAAVPLWKHPFVVFFLALGVVLLLATISGIFSSDDPAARSADRGAEPAGMRAPVEVAVTSELPASDLYIDGAKVGELESGQTLFLELRPGAYRLEARAGDEILSRSDVLIRPGRDTSIGLKPSSRVPDYSDDLIDEEMVDEEPEPARPVERRQPAPSAAPVQQPPSKSAPADAAPPSDASSAKAPGSESAPSAPSPKSDAAPQGESVEGAARAGAPAVEPERKQLPLEEGRQEEKAGASEGDKAERQPAPPTKDEPGPGAAPSDPPAERKEPGDEAKKPSSGSAEQGAEEPAAKAPSNEHEKTAPSPSEPEQKAGASSSGGDGSEKSSNAASERPAQPKAPVVDESGSINAEPKR